MRPGSAGLPRAPATQRDTDVRSPQKRPASARAAVSVRRGGVTFGRLYWGRGVRCNRPFWRSFDTQPESSTGGLPAGRIPAGVWQRMSHCADGGWNKPRGPSAAREQAPISFNSQHEQPSPFNESHDWGAEKCACCQTAAIITLHAGLWGEKHNLISTWAYLRALRRPSTLFGGWSLRTLMQPFICGQETGR